MERLKGMNRDRIRLEGMVRPAAVSVEEAKKVLRAWEMESVRSRLRGMASSRVSYSEFLRICGESAGFDRGLEIARDLDESGAVIILGGLVFLRPDEVAKAIERVLPVKNESENKELKEMEKKKAEMEEKAEAEVRRELWAGLGLLVMQTVGFMRLTFWELTWDVMEPICFFFTSTYFMAGYAFFLSTSKEPSFQAIFQSRFEAKMERLMKLHHFDVKRFNHLRMVVSSSSSFDSHHADNPCC
ncbi:calcium uniporter protein 2, mitochondrial-like [Dioscorea cayenensis subsp. rotundata]|uniref:Calcium uniporter protein 2, mitochondrial-like n=1 Tax=Dioscorea cayennensis subsp. rotundata TaxID=55577 RepID=A0AB40CG44_DIOCR|nr:calcium uniporter protein 2, mitochondrial-like [Dioscorea cayenensis subsp. rotundata]